MNKEDRFTNAILTICAGLMAAAIGTAFIFSFAMFLGH